jgi:hypothetical protein
MVAQIARAFLNNNCRTPTEFYERYSGRCASDAHATETEASLGGWISDHDPPQKWNCDWFAIKLDPSVTPWVWARKEPKRVIAALELLGLALLQKMNNEKQGSSHVVKMRLSGTTDNRGNSLALLKEYSRKPPSAYVHMELALTAYHNNTLWEIDHRKREFNIWADALSNLQTEGFDPSRRWKPEMGQPGFFLILNTLMSLGTTVTTATRGSSDTVEQGDQRDIPKRAKRS